MPQRIKALVAGSDALSSIPGAHVVEEKINTTRLFSDLQTQTCTLRRQSSLLQMESCAECEGSTDHVSMHGALTCTAQDSSVHCPGVCTAQ